MPTRAHARRRGCRACRGARACRRRTRWRHTVHRRPARVVGASCGRLKGLRVAHRACQFAIRADGSTHRCPRSTRERNYPLPACSTREMISSFTSSARSAKRAQYLHGRATFGEPIREMHSRGVPAHAHEQVRVRRRVRVRLSEHSGVQAVHLRSTRRISRVNLSKNQSLHRSKNQSINQSMTN